MLRTSAAGPAGRPPIRSARAAVPRCASKWGSSPGLQGPLHAASDSLPPPFVSQLPRALLDRCKLSSVHFGHRCGLSSTPAAVPCRAAVPCCSPVGPRCGSRAGPPLPTLQFRPHCPPRSIHFMCKGMSQARHTAECTAGLLAAAPAAPGWPAATSDSACSCACRPCPAQPCHACACVFFLNSLAGGGGPHVCPRLRLLPRLPSRQRSVAGAARGLPGSSHPASLPARLAQQRAPAERTTTQQRPSWPGRRP